ncbi:hypothetical protein A1O1_08000 [Capronia coronata CBS 617.96]|uniref:Aminoglycoside phosphotransferase domain-containing protein n=1 Tax=Capronia coronata CBS 617.96 TaxID=1182541 RepID=W9XP08_9EURO|nr:uncharacterized protein A1O1_08000 [Capronia coronata CBS 617.96]EXJ81933.1 hypothetical protein A1O1_08000 [Capronia coronata CBS 617.96]
MRNDQTHNVVPDVDADRSDPTSIYKDLEFIDDPGSRGRFFYCYDQEYMKELCWACGWTTVNQEGTSYAPRLRVMHARGNMGIWAIGDRWVLRDETNDRWLGNNYMTLKFLQEQPGLTIPIPQGVRSLSEPSDSISLTLESRVPGVSLLSIYRTLSPEEKTSYVRQMADALRQLRQFTAPRMQKVDGSQLDDFVIAECMTSRPGNCFQIPYQAADWLDHLGVDLRMGLSSMHDTVDPAEIEAKFQQLKDNFIECEPYVLSHGDLNLTNIIVKDGKIQGIIDWERAGYYPWWYERSIKYVHGESVDFFQAVWPLVEPEVEQEKFEELLKQRFFPAQYAWGHLFHEHLGEGTTWLKPRWCECHPYTGQFKGKYWGKPLSCQISQLTPAEQALLARYDRKDPWPRTQLPDHGHDEPDSLLPSAGHES